MVNFEAAFDGECEFAELVLREAAQRSWVIDGHMGDGKKRVGKKGRAGGGGILRAGSPWERRREGLPFFATAIFAVLHWRFGLALALFFPLPLAFGAAAAFAAGS